MKYLYILLICLILFYIITRYFEKYYSQENFDPSLVPVSSIITLAKVAQKIVDGNGTLTNPANLNIGTTNAKGNLLVTGNTRTNGNEIVDGTLSVTSATTVGGTLGVTGATTVGGTLGVTGATTLSNTLGVTGNTSVGGTLGVTGASTIGGTLGVTGATTIGASGAPAATNNLTINGATKITGNTTIGGTVTLPSHILTATPDKNYFLLNNKNNTNVLSIGQGGDTYITGGTTIGTTAANASLSVNGNTNITGSLTINGITLSNVGGVLNINTPIAAAGTITAKVPRGSGAFTILGPGGYPDSSTILRSGYGQTYNVDYMYQGDQNYGVSTWGGGGGKCTNNNNSACV